VLIFPIATFGLIRLNRKYRQEQLALTANKSENRATTIARHDVAVLVDNVDIATISAVRYARSLNPRHLTAVHFVIDDQRADQVSSAWKSNPGLSDVPLELIDCPDRRLPNAAVDYAIRATASKEVELTLLLPRRSYSGVLGRVLHDRTAEAIAAPISQLDRVVATIVPFDVEKIISGQSVVVHDDHERIETVPTKVVAPKVAPQRLAPANPDSGPVSHYAEEVFPIGSASWRKRAHVRGHVTSIRTAPTGGAPKVEVEIWDSTGGITLQFLGRRDIAGLEVGSTVCAEGMVGEENGSLTILNPSYEIII